MPRLLVLGSTRRSKEAGRWAVLDGLYLTRLSTNMEAESLADSLRQDTVEIVREDLEQSPYPMPPADPNPWWSIKYKTNLYLYPERQGNSFDQMAENFMHRHIGVSKQIAPRHLPKVKDVMHFVVQTKAPPYPWPLDSERVERGRKVFHEKKLGRRGIKTCATCHGNYRLENGKLIVEYVDYYEDVSTDPAVFEVGKYMMDKTLKRVDPAEVPNYKPYEQERGYPAPPLMGVWASAPYLHNGSIPTLYDVIKLRARPKVWARPFDPRAYDQKKVGIQVVDPERAHDPSFVYDTQRTGYSNKGHVYGNDWDDETIYDVIEFLKSLSE